MGPMPDEHKRDARQNGQRLNADLVVTLQHHLGIKLEVSPHLFTCYDNSISARVIHSFGQRSPASDFSKAATLDHAQHLWSTT
jgi:hypothetical protein